MNNNNFAKYANYYDLLYRDKDYAEECLILKKYFKKFGVDKVSTILDLGCGTGSHIVYLAKMGYKMTGIDSSPEMLKFARKKLANLKNVELKKADMRRFHLEYKVDAAIAMFNAVGYLKTTSEFDSMLKSVRNNLNNNGLFIFDLWYKPAVLSDPPHQKTKIIKNNNLKLIRVADPKVDISKNLIYINYDIFLLNNKKVTDYFNETHIQQLYGKEMVTRLLAKRQFELLRIFPFGQISKKLSNKTWHIQIIAKAI